MLGVLGLPDGSRRSRSRALVLAAVIAAASPVARAEEPASADDLPHRTHQGVFSLSLENDTFTGNDNRYTNGFSFSWVSADVAMFGPRNFFSRMVDAGSFLPTVGNEGYRNFAGFAVGQEIYTPDDIKDPDPPEDQQPYAGVAFIDTSLFSMSARSLHHFKLRVGIVGPASGAEWTQIKLHELINSPIPQGWDTQLSNELLLNAFYQYNRRMLRKAPPAAFGYDLTLNGGGGLGNYYTGGNAGIQFRLGRAVPDTYGSFDLRAGGDAFVGIAEPADGWQTFLQLQGNLAGIARFLPSDGNTFVDSRSAERSDFIATLGTGLVVAYRRFVFSYTYNAVVGDKTLPGSDLDDYGAVVLAFVLGSPRKQP